MAAQNLVVHARGGSTDRPAVALSSGRPVEAFSVGSSGSWSIRAPGLAPTHAYLFFDGQQLFVAGAPGADVRLGNAPVGADWVAVNVPGDILLGGLTLSVRPQEQTQRPGPGARSPQALPRAQPGPEPRGRPAQTSQPGSARQPQWGPGGQHQVDPRRKSTSGAGAPPQSGPGTRARIPEPQAVPAVRAGAAHPGGDAPGRPGDRSSQPAQQVGHTDYNEADDAPTAFQPIPPEFLEEESASEKTTVMPAGGQPMPAPESSPRPAAGVPASASQPKPSRPERPAPPSSPPASGGEATVVKPLEEFLAESGGGAPQPLPAPTGPPQGARGVYIQPPEPTMPPGGEHLWNLRMQQQRGGAQQSSAQGPAPGVPGHVRQGDAVPVGPGQGYPGQGHPGPGQMQPGPGQMQPGPGQMQPGPGHPSEGQPGPAQLHPGQAHPGQMPPGQPAPGGKPSPVDEVVNWWRSASIPRRIMVFLAPLGMISFYLIFFNDPAAQRRRPRPSPSASTSAGQSASAPPPSASLAVPPLVAADAAATSPPPAPDAAAVAPVSDSGEPDPRIRAAVDAVAAGEFEKAAGLYRKLAESYPNDPAYKQAAEILERRTGKRK